MHITQPEGASFKFPYVYVGDEVSKHGAGVTIQGAKPGDVNEDGSVDINDVVAIINVMAGTANWKNANVNGDSDGNVDINDVVAVINVMAGK